MRVTLGQQQVNFSRLMKIARQNPAVRELRLATLDYLAVAVKEPTTPTPPVKPNDAGPDWKPPAPPPPPAFTQFSTTTGTVRIVPDASLQRGEVEAL